MAADKKLKSALADSLRADSQTVETALKKGIRHALLKHKQAENQIAIWHDGKVVLLSPDKILLDKASDF